jgi:hypothetical protein
MHRWGTPERRTGSFISSAAVNGGKIRHLFQHSDLDAQYLLRNLGKLVGNSGQLNPMTLDLSRNRALGKSQVQLRFRSMSLSIEPSDAPITELTLDRSSCESTPMQLAIDHHFMLNADPFSGRRRKSG